MPNASAGFVNIGKLPVYNNIKNPSIHVNIAFLVVGVKGASSMKRRPFTSSNWNAHLTLAAKDLLCQ